MFSHFINGTAVSSTRVVVSGSMTLTATSIVPQFTIDPELFKAALHRLYFRWFEPAFEPFLKVGSQVILKTMHYIQQPNSKDLRSLVRSQFLKKLRAA